MVSTYGAGKAMGLPRAFMKVLSGMEGWTKIDGTRLQRTLHSTQRSETLIYWAVKSHFEVQRT